jgi:hypothetical protein
MILKLDVEKMDQCSVILASLEGNGPLSRI